jgi:hypothetical protein
MKNYTFSIIHSHINSETGDIEQTARRVTYKGVNEEDAEIEMYQDYPSHTIQSIILMKVQHIKCVGDKVLVGNRSGKITQIFPGDDVTTCEVTYTDGSFSIECL